MNEFEKEFIPYEQALALKELGFDEPCFGGFNFKDGRTGEFTYPSAKDPNTTSKARVYHKDKKIVGAPLYSQAFRWFREKYGLRNAIIPYWVGDTYMVVIDGKMIAEIEPIQFKTHEEAELACLKKLIEIVKDKK